MPKARKQKPIIRTSKQQLQQTQVQKKHGGSAASKQHAAGGGVRKKVGKRRPEHASDGTPRHAGGIKRAPGKFQCMSVVDRQAAAAVQALLEADAGRAKGASIKTLTLAPHIQAKRATYAVTCQTMKYLLVLQEVVARAGVPTDTATLSPASAYVLAYELLIGEGLHQRGAAERALLKHKAKLQAALKQMMEEKGAETVSDLLPQAAGHAEVAPHPRYVRVNTLKISVLDAADQLRAAGHTAISRDSLIPDLLVLPHGTDLHDHPLVGDGGLVLQSKASCMSAAALAPQPGWTVVDCCAAPGNKTTHAAALMQGKGTVFAFDKDPARLQRLVSNVQRAGATGVIHARCDDFLSLDTSAPEFAQVCGVILDPSCSGSGTVVTRGDLLVPSAQRRAAALLAVGEAGGQGQRGKRGRGEDGEDEEAGEGQEEAGEEEGEEEETEDGEEGGNGSGDTSGDMAKYVPEDPEELRRAQQLAKFQLAALRHALTFPALQRLVYSTCSVWAAENEEVVAAALEDAHEAGFELQDPFPSWHRRGLPLVDGHEKLVRTDPYLDGTDGFFVAVFQRKGVKAAGAAAAAAKPKGRATQAAAKGTGDKPKAKSGKGAGGVAAAATSGNVATAVPSKAKVAAGKGGSKQSSAPVEKRAVQTSGQAVHLAKKGRDDGGRKGGAGSVPAKKLKKSK